MTGNTLAISGANGFVGSALCSLLAARSIPHVALLRNGTVVNCDPGGSDCTQPPATPKRMVDYHSVHSIEAALSGCSTLIHLIAKTHSDTGMSHRHEYHRSNVQITERVARAATGAGLRRVVYLSSIKVLAETTQGRALRATDTPRPRDAYGTSKWQAEQFLQSFCPANGMQWVVLRSPLVYAAHAKGNIATLQRALRKGIPLPLAAIANRRSIVDLATLCEQLLWCAQSDVAPGKIWLSSAETLSTPQLVRKLAHELKLSPRLVNIPPWMLKFTARCAGKPELWDKLGADLEVDGSELENAMRDYMNNEKG